MEPSATGSDQPKISLPSRLPVFPQILRAAAVAERSHPMPPTRERGARARWRTRHSASRIATRSVGFGRK